ncbi:MAG TPA: hypothetical protein VFA55_04835 [Candidatus Kapabacteria bacterium]|nr:hypothetical protein [Candidatus Kapabacteria bacterium]
MTATFSAREKLFYIIDRLRRERKFTWREAWKQVSETDKKVNNRNLFPTYKSFEHFQLRYMRDAKVGEENPENEIKIDEMHDFGSISEGALVFEMLTTSGYHVNQTDRSGKDQLDREEAEYEKDLERRMRKAVIHHG